MMVNNWWIMAAWWLSPIPLKNHGVSSPVGMIFLPFPTEWKVIKHLPVTTKQMMINGD